MTKDTMILLNKIINADSYTIDDSIINEAKKLIKKEMVEDIKTNCERIFRYSWSRTDIKKAIQNKNIFELFRLINGYADVEKCLEYYLEEVGVKKLFELLDEVIKSIEELEKEED